MPLGKLSIVERKDLEHRKLVCSQQRKALQEAILTYNLAAEALYQTTMAEAIEAYNEAVANMNGFIEDVVNDQQDQFNSRSEKWQEGDNAAIVTGWIEEWEGADPIPDYDEELRLMPEIDTEVDEAEAIANLRLSADDDE